MKLITFFNIKIPILTIQLYVYFVQLCINNLFVVISTFGCNTLWLYCSNCSQSDASFFKTLFGLIRFWLAYQCCGSHLLICTSPATLSISNAVNTVVVRISSPLMLTKPSIIDMPCCIEPDDGRWKKQSPDILTQIGAEHVWEVIECAEDSAILHLLVEVDQEVLPEFSGIPEDPLNSKK